MHVFTNVFAGIVGTAPAGDTLVDLEQDLDHVAATDVGGMGVAKGGGGGGVRTAAQVDRVVEVETVTSPAEGGRGERIPIPVGGGPIPDLQVHSLIGQSRVPVPGTVPIPEVVHVLIPNLLIDTSQHRHLPLEVRLRSKKVPGARVPRRLSPIPVPEVEVGRLLEKMWRHLTRRKRGEFVSVTV